MAERIMSVSHFEISGGKLEKAIINEANHDQEVKNFYLSQFQPVWIKWTKAKGPHLISPFLEIVGPHIFIDYLTKLFSFDPTKLKVQIKKGKSNVDAIINLTYLYDKEELKILKKLKEKYRIVHIDKENEIAKTLLSNCVKSMSKFLSNIINIKYRLFTSQIETNLKEDNTMEIILALDGRIG